MRNNIESLIWKLREDRRLTLEEYAQLIRERDEEGADLLARLAREQAQAVYGNRVFVRGLIEISNLCKNDCLYCGIRRSLGILCCAAFTSYFRG